MKRILTVIAVTTLATAVGRTANLLWVSDQLPIGSGATDHDGGAAGIFGPGAGPYPDEGIISLLTGAGHNVTRFNPANATPLNAADIATLNTFDLLIIGRSIGSGSFDTAAEVLPWNTAITRPILCTNTYINRFIRLGWYTAGTNQPDVVSNPLTFGNLADPISTYLVGTTAMSGDTTTNSMTEAITYPDTAVDIRGTSLITDPINASATTIATASGGAFIASWPAGTVLNGQFSGGQVLSGYRMQFLIGNRESATAPNNVVGSAGFENLTPEGEQMFLRAVLLAANNGVVPEPGSVALMALAAAGFLRRRR